MVEMNMAKAINLALLEAMTKDPKVIVMGEDVGQNDPQRPLDRIPRLLVEEVVVLVDYPNIEVSCAIRDVRNFESGRNGPAVSGPFEQRSYGVETQNARSGCELRCRLARPQPGLNFSRGGVINSPAVGGPDKFHI